MKRTWPLAIVALLFAACNMMPAPTPADALAERPVSFDTASLDTAATDLVIDGGFEALNYTLTATSSPWRVDSDKVNETYEVVTTPEHVFAGKQALMMSGDYPWLIQSIEVEANSQYSASFFYKHYQSTGTMRGFRLLVNGWDAANQKTKLAETGNLSSPSYAEATLEFTTGSDTQRITLEFFNRGAAWTNPDTRGDITWLDEVSLVKLEVTPPDSGDNLALGKPATASSTFQENTADRAVDGDEGTYWSSGTSAASSLQLDLEGYYDLSGAAFMPVRDDRFVRYTLEGSQDGEMWLTLVDNSQNAVRTDRFSHALEASYVRYVRLNILSVESNNWGGARELQLFGAPSPEDLYPPTAPTDLTATGITNTSLTLSWGASTDDNGIAAYEIFESDNLLRTVAGNVTAIQLVGLARDTDYAFAVRARDVAGKLSDFSPVLNVRTTDRDVPYFRVDGTRILDPEGNEFIIKGANVMAYNAAWPVQAIEHLELFQLWNFNFARLYARLDMDYTTGGGPGHNRDLDHFYEIIDAYTAAGIVVMIEAHDKTGSYYTDDSTPSLTELAEFHASLAARYIDNPYVWFNVMNEPGGASLDPQWITTHQRVIAAIRDTGNNSIIVADGSAWGQDVGEWNPNPVREERSAILSYGHLLKEFDGQSYDNIMFSIHTYDQWRFGDAKLIDYIERVHALGHALMIGEFGSWNNNYSFEALDTAMRVAPDKGVGLVVWHWWGGDRNRLTVRREGTNGGGQWIDRTDGTKPTNLTYLGNLVWDYNHDQLTEASFDDSLEKDPDAPPVLPKPATNVIDDFESYGSDEELAASWVHPGHGGTTSVSLSAEPKHSGEQAMKLDYTTSSTHAGRRLVIDQNWSDYEGLSLWVKPDGSGRRLVIQLVIANVSWEYDYILSGTEATMLTIPFTSFLHPTNMGGMPDVSAISQLNLYINNNFRDSSLDWIPRGSGTLYFDSIRLVPDGEEPEPSYTFEGFFDPVQNDLSNPIRAGRTVPLRWRIIDAEGEGITTLESVTVTVEDCATETRSSSQESAAGASGLQNLGDGHYQFNWQTPRVYAGSCKIMHLDLGAGITHTARFEFR